MDWEKACKVLVAAIVGLAFIMVCLGCAVNLKIVNEYAAQTGNGEIVESLSSKDDLKAEADIEADVDGGL